MQKSHTFVHLKVKTHAFFMRGGGYRYIVVWPVVDLLDDLPGAAFILLVARVLWRQVVVLLRLDGLSTWKRKRNNKVMLYIKKKVVKLSGKKVAYNIISLTFLFLFLGGSISTNRLLPSPYRWWSSKVCAISSGRWYIYIVRISESFSCFW